MSGPSGQETVNEPPKPTRLWRNGMDYEPKKTIPPDYSNVPDIRDWQMSPFSHERFDLDEIQRAEQKGLKGLAELERLKQVYGGGKKVEEKKKDECEVCAERERKEGLRSNTESRKCTSELLYQPYGPIVLSAVSYSRPESNKPKMYSYMGPSILSGFPFGKGILDRNPPPLPCNAPEVQPRDLRNVYIPFGPYGEIRITPDQYVPMGPPPASPYK